MSGPKRYRMSVSMTLEAVRERRKTVTRRHEDTWVKLKAGDRLVLIEKGQGLKKGEHQVVVTEVEVTSVRVEPVTLMTSDVRYGRQECALEGLPQMTPDEFVAFWAKGHKERLHDDEGLPLRPKCRRIEWRYLDGEVTR